LGSRVTTKPRTTTKRGKSSNNNSAGPNYVAKENNNSLMPELAQSLRVLSGSHNKPLDKPDESKTTNLAQLLMVLKHQLNDLNDARSHAAAS
jgi:hypothetical protein